MTGQHYGLSVVTPPSSEPVTLADMKLFLKVDVTDDDALITGLITAAREYIEETRDRAFVQRTYLWTLDSFFGYPVPAGQSLLGHRPVPQQRGGGWYWPTYAPVLQPPRPPLVSVTSLQYTDPAQGLLTLDPSQYQVDTVSRPGRLIPAYGQVWPVTKEVPNAVQVTYVAGEGTVPERLKLAVKLLVGWWYQHRDDAASKSTDRLPLGLAHLIASVDSGGYR